MDSRLGVLQLAQSGLANGQQLEIYSYVLDETELRIFCGDHLGVEQKTVGRKSDIGFTSDIRFQNRGLLKLDLVTELESRFRGAESALQEAYQSITAQLALHQP